MIRRKKKIIASLLFTTALLGTLTQGAYAYGGGTTLKGVYCSAALTKSGNTFSAGTYANHAMDELYVYLDGQGEWWASSSTKKIQEM
ncbi:hypothetical protein [Clostridium sp. N3C]|uniref:hypothetical protein n=1 Tax=Clostridium sp. N3C TaxID=1776758 RepID=UPI0009452BCA|nr:hypothetical protein [Clostridium sp. N3C]